MTKMELATVVAEKVGGVVREVEKANGIIAIGIVKETTGISPTVYIDPYWHEGFIDVDEVVEAVKDVFENAIVPDINLDFIKDYFKVKPMLRARLYNKATKAEVFMSAKNAGFDDLIVIPYVVISANAEDGIAAIKVNNWMLEQWNKCDLEVIADALINSKEEVTRRPFRETIAELMGIPVDDLPFVVPDMEIISNTSHQFGAIGILIKLNELKQRYPNGFTVLPASVHEVLIYPEADASLSSMVGAVNMQEVKDVDVLSNNVYVFNELPKENVDEYMDMLKMVYSM